MACGVRFNVALLAENPCSQITMARNSASKTNKKTPHQSRRSTNRVAVQPNQLAESFFANVHQEHGQSLFDALEGVYFFIKDLQGRYMRANRTMCAAHGLGDESQIIGRTDHDFTARHLADEYVRDDQRVFAGQAVWDRVELVLRHSGCPEWYVTSKIPLRSTNGTIVSLAGISRHLSDAAIRLLPYARLQPALEQVREHFSTSITVSELAQRCHLSTRQFQRAFLDMFHLTPKEYLRQFRLGHGIDLLISGDASLTTIAQQSGFTDHSHFTRAFVKAMGMTPGAYRRKYQHVS